MLPPVIMGLANYETLLFRILALFWTWSHTLHTGLRRPTGQFHFLCCRQNIHQGALLKLCRNLLPFHTECCSVLEQDCLRFNQDEAKHLLAMSLVFQSHNTTFF